MARTPEATHFVTWLYTDVGTIKSLRKIRTYGVNTYVWRNAAGETFYVKYHWLPMAGEETIDRFEAVKLAGENPDVAGQDLYDTIAAGTPVEFELNVQIMRPEMADQLPYDPLDDTKTWDEGQFPLIPVGRMTLDRNPENYDSQTEKVAFSPANLLPGVELSTDKMLQGRSTVYWDAQRHRLGQDFREIPVNMQKGFTPDQLVTSGVGSQISGVAARTEYPKEDNFMQAGERYQNLSNTQKAHLIDNIASQLYAVVMDTQQIVMDYFRQASPEMAERIAAKMMEYARKN